MASKNPYDAGVHDPALRAAAKIASTTHGVPEDMLHAALKVLAKKESGFRPDITGKVKLDDGTYAQGMFQYRPTTSKQLGIDPFNVTQSATAAANDAAKAFKRGGIAEVAASHFAGAGGTGRGPKTREYVRDFLAGMGAVGAPAHMFAPTRNTGGSAPMTAQAAPAEANPFSAMAAAEPAEAEVPTAPEAAPEGNPFAVTAEAAPEGGVPDGMQEHDPVAEYDTKAPAPPQLARLETNPFGGHDAKRDPTTLKWFESMIENADG